MRKKDDIDGNGYVRLSDDMINEDTFRIREIGMISDV
jgi:hypothetical protein